MDFSLVYPGERTRFAVLLIIAIIAWAGIFIASFGLVLLYLFAVFIFFLFIQSAFVAYVKGTAVRISQSQYADLAQSLDECCATLGIREAPAAYVLHADRFFNAMAARFLNRHYVIIFSSVLDALEDSPDAVRFYLGHELGHIKQGHMLWGPVLSVAAWLPLLGAAYRRAQEYTCDRYGLACCGDPETAFNAMAALASGETRWKQFNLDAYASQRYDVRGFWGSLHELTSDYPWTAKRAYAIQALTQHEHPRQPRRNPFAYVFALFALRAPGGGGSAGTIIAIFILATALAVALPAYQSHEHGKNRSDAARHVPDKFRKTASISRTRPRGDYVDARSRPPSVA